MAAAAKTVANGGAPKSSSSASSFFFWTIFCVGFGVLGGFGLFLYLYQTECQGLVEASREGAVDHARAELRREIDECQFNTQALQAQVSSARQMATVEKSKMELQHAQELEAVKLGIKQQVETSSRHILELEQALEQALAEVSSQISKDDEIKQLSDEKSRLQQALEETRQANAAQQVNQNDSNQQLQTLQTDLQKRFLEQTKLKYGTDTFHVELTLDLGAPDLQTIVIQMDRLDTMPMTTATFFYLLEAGLYTGTDLYVTDTSNDEERILHGGEISSERTQARWTAHGYTRETPLLWANEVNSRQAPCPRFGFGLDWHSGRGGDFFIQLGGLPNASSRPCLGRVIMGMGLLDPQTRGTLAHARIRGASREVPPGEEL